MIYCFKCGETLEEGAKFCSKCGSPQSGQQIETNKNTSKKSTSKFKKLDFAGMTPREYFREAAKRGAWTEKNAEELSAFLVKKNINQKLYPKAEKALKEMSDLYTEYQKRISEDRPFEEMQKYLREMKSNANEVYTDFEKTIETVLEKEKAKQEGKQKFNDFNEKKREVYEKLKTVSPNNGSCDDKDCGYNNCYALAMKIAAGKEDYDSCPHIDDENENTGISCKDRYRLMVNMLKEKYGKRLNTDAHFCTECGKRL
jgi:ArsR family metal-binding transcriptional regulator